jgi:hypothetical protein
MSDKIISIHAGSSRRKSRSQRPEPQRPPVPRVPDFARADATWLHPKDIAFLLEATGQASNNNALITEDVSPAIEALLERDAVYRQVVGDAGGWLDISPQLYFHVVLRRRLPKPRNYLQRRVIRYLANLLSLFVRTDRLYRIQPGEAQTFEYLVDLLSEAAESEHERRFLVHAHLGNYALYLAGISRGWIEHRLRYGRSALGVDYYRDMGRNAYHQAANHRLARELDIALVLDYLARRFDGYARALQQLQRGWQP